MTPEPTPAPDPSGWIARFLEATAANLDAEPAVSGVPEPRRPSEGAGGGAAIDLVRATQLAADVVEVAGLIASGRGNSPLLRRRLQALVSELKVVEQRLRAGAGGRS